MENLVEKRSLDMRERVAANIKRYRQKAGYTQVSLAKRLGVSQRYVAMLEQNARNLSLDSLARIAVSLEVDISDLVCHQEKVDHATRNAAQLGIELLQKHLNASDM